MVRGTSIPDRQQAPALLHNMSCAPRSQIQHRSPYRRARGRGIVFALRGDQDMLAELTGCITGGLSLTPRDDAERELRRRIDAHARTLPFPAAALVTDRAEPEDEPCEDLLTIITVLAKSSGHVYLRDKAPNLNQIKPGRRVILLVPEERRTSCPSSRE